MPRFQIRRLPFVSFAIAFALALGSLSRPAVVVAATSSCSVDGVERIVAIGDVHGAYDRFVEILQTAGLIDARQHWSGGTAHLVQVGDVLDRGPDSRKALDLLHRLEQEAASAHGAVHWLLGNHEVMRMLGDLRYVTPGEYQAFVTPDSEKVRANYLRTQPGPPDQLVKDTPLGLVEMRVAFGRQGQYGEWLRKLDPVARINGILFMHGGLSKEVADIPCDTINATVHRELTTDLDKTRAAPLKSLVAGENGPLWYRGLTREPDEFAPTVAEILAKQHARAMVVGHTIVPEGRIKTRFDGRLVMIDTGMQPAYVPGGRASALDIQHGTYTAIYTDRRDELGAVPGESRATAPAR